MIENTLHLKAPGNWINDPNGFIYYKGKYHLFYQHFPYAPIWGTMHWGHAVSTDLVHWEHVGIVLFPTRYEDSNGCFSGSAIEHDGKMSLYYTGIHYNKINAENIHIDSKDYDASQLMISSEDGIHFDNFDGKRVVIPRIDDIEIGDCKDTRDPKVWKDGDCFYMVLGSTYRGEMGRALFYKSEDGENWTYVSQFRSERFGKTLECPDIFKIGDSYVFVGSPMYIAKDAGGYEHHAVCMQADFEPGRCSLSLHGNYQYIDYGLDLYAPQTNVDAAGRRVMIAWLRMPKAVEQEGKEPWNGMMCLPRVVELENGHIYFRVHPEVDTFFEKEILSEEKIFDGEKDFQALSVHEGEPYRIRVTLKKGETLDIGGFKIRVERDFIKTDRSSVFGDIKGHRMVSNTPKVYGNYELDIFVEPNLIEVFVNGGEYVISNAVYGLGSYMQENIEKILVGKDSDV